MSDDGNSKITDIDDDSVDSSDWSDVLWWQ